MATNNAINQSAAGYVVYNGTGTFSGRTFQAGTGISLTNADGTAGNTTIAVTGGGLTWVVVSGTTQAMAVNTGYTVNNGSLVTLTLPSSAAVGDTIVVSGLGAGGWTIAQNASQLIHVGAVATTTGVGGSIASTNRYDAITFTCVVANNEWITRATVGNLTIV